MHKMDAIVPTLYKKVHIPINFRVITLNDDPEILIIGFTGKLVLQLDEDLGID